jgi:hypothetical protein
MFSRIRNTLARALSTETVETVRPSPSFLARAEQARRAPCAPSRASRLSTVSMADPIGSVYTLAEEFGEWFESLPAEAQRVARWNLECADAEIVREFLAEAIGARIVD